MIQPGGPAIDMVEQAARAAREGTDFTATIKRAKAGRASYISLGQLQAGKKYLTDNKSVNKTFILPCQMDTLPPPLA
mgnify:CR=1 FL=1